MNFSNHTIFCVKFVNGNLQYAYYCLGDVEIVGMRAEEVSNRRRTNTDIFLDTNYNYEEANAWVEILLYNYDLTAKNSRHMSLIPSCDDCPVRYECLTNSVELYP